MGKQRYRAVWNTLLDGGPGRVTRGAVLDGTEDPLDAHPVLGPDRVKQAAYGAERRQPGVTHPEARRRGESDNGR
jgi:hypothetical protein